MGKKKRNKETKKVANTAAVSAPVANAVGIGGGSNYSGYPGGSPFLETSSTIDPLQMNLRYYLISNFRQFLNELYTEIGLIQTIVDVPVDDALRGGIEIKTKQLDEEQIEELTNELDRRDDLNTCGQGAKWNRLFGGAGILLLVKGHNPADPLDIAQLGPDTPLDIRAVDMWELFTDRQSTDNFDPGIQSPNAEFYSYYGEPIHKSRVLVLIGQTAPSFVRPRLRGWGLSVVEAIVQSINQYERANNVSFEVLDEFKVDIYKIKNLVNTLMSPTGAQEVQSRIALANRTKNYQNAIVMDSEDDYLQKQVSFAGFADAMAQIRMQVAAALRMPLTKLFGISAAGFNSGEDDIEVYNSMVESQVRSKIKSIVLTVVQIRCQQLFGMIPDDLSISFQPLREMSSEQEETVKTQKFTRLQQAMAGGYITIEEFRDACNRGELFDIQLDTSLAITTMAEQMLESQAQDSDEEADDKLANSSKFDKASYEADGGDSSMPDGRKYFFDEAKAKDKSLWHEAVNESMAIYGQENWKFTVWLYQKRGGGF